jgi:hypothetical protein
MENLKALLAKAWKDEELDLDPGRHYFDEVLTVRVSGTVEKQADQLVAPTTSMRWKRRSRAWASRSPSKKTWICGGWTSR